MTYSILGRDRATGQMGLATQSQAFAVGSSVPWSEPGYGVIATQSVAEPAYGELGLDLLRGGLPAPQALAALLGIDPHPERRQLAMIDGAGRIEVHTGEGCVPAAGHSVDDSCASLANMVASPEVWEAMTAAFCATTGALAGRLVAGLEAAEAAGGDIRGQRSAAVTVVRAERSGLPWRDRIVDLRVDDHHEPVNELRRLVDTSDRYHRAVLAFELAIDGEPDAGVLAFAELAEEAELGPDARIWRVLALALAGDEDAASRELRDVAALDERFVETFRRFGPAGLANDALVERIADAAT
jgi:uncharacterized Ntn-hydrolase superfamily protein